MTRQLSDSTSVRCSPADAGESGRICLPSTMRKMSGRKFPPTVSDIKQKSESGSLETWVYKLLSVIHKLFHSTGPSSFMCYIKMIAHEPLFLGGSMIFF